MPRDEFLELKVHQTTSSLRGKMRPKLAPSRSLGRKRTGRSSGGVTQHQGSETAAFFLVTQHEASRCGLTQSRGTVNGQRLAPSRESCSLLSPCQGEASRNALLFQPPSPHSLLSHTFYVSRPRSKLSPLSLTSCPLIIHSRGMASSLSFLEAGVLACSERAARLLLLLF